MDTAFIELRAAEVSIAAACALTGRSRATHYRRADPTGVRLGPLHGPRPPRRLLPSTITDEQRGQVLAVLASPLYRDLAIPQVWARELDEGRYWCSESSMYRIARAAGQSRERRAQAVHPARVRPEAGAPRPLEGRHDDHHRPHPQGHRDINAERGLNDFPTHVVDVVGVGAGVYDRLAELGVPVAAYNGGEAPYERAVRQRSSRGLLEPAGDLRRGRGRHRRARRCAGRSARVDQVDHRLP